MSVSSQSLCPRYLHATLLPESLGDVPAAFFRPGLKGQKNGDFASIGSRPQLDLQTRIVLEGWTALFAFVDAGAMPIAAAPCSTATEANWVGGGDERRENERGEFHDGWWRKVAKKSSIALRRKAR